jgi:hypothetical protein
MTLREYKIRVLIKMLHSANAYVRYEACEELRVMSEIPEEARTALQELLNDPDADVADAARRALGVPTEKQAIVSSTVVSASSEPKGPIRMGDFGLAILGYAITSFALILVIVVLNFSTYGNLIGLGRNLMLFLFLPFIPGLGLFRLFGLFYFVALIIAIGRRNVPSNRTTVIIVGIIMGFILAFLIFMLASQT